MTLEGEYGKQQKSCPRQRHDSEEDRHTEWSDLRILGSAHHYGLRCWNRSAEAAFCYRQDAKEVREKLQALAVEVNSGTYQEPCRMTLGEWLDIWVETT